MATEYRIQIQNELSVKTEEKTSKSGNVKEASDKVREKANQTTETTSKSNPALAIAIQLGQQAVRNALANYGNLTGDYITQSYLQIGAEFVGDVATIVKGGWAGVAMVGAKVGSKVGTYIIGEIKQRNSNSLLAERLGIK